MKKVRAFGFDQSAVRDMGKLFLPETSKTLTNGSSPGHHNGIVVAINGWWLMDEDERSDRSGLIQSKPYRKGGENIECNKE